MKKDDPHSTLSINVGSAPSIIVLFLFRLFGLVLSKRTLAFRNQSALLLFYETVFIYVSELHLSRN